MSSAIVEQKINTQEWKDFQRAKMLLTSHFNAQAVKVQKFIPREKGCSVDALIDIEYQNKKRTLNLEIKERHKNESLIKRYPFAELKVEKLNNMRLENKKNGGDLKYLSLYSNEENGELECAFFFDLSTLQNDNFLMSNFNSGAYKKEDGFQQPQDVNLKFDNQGISFVEKGDVRFQTDYHYTYMKMKDTEFQEDSEYSEKLILNLPLKYAKVIYLNPKYKEKYRFLFGNKGKVKYNYIVRTTQCHS
jgi:hypothetical protein